VLPDLLAWRNYTGTPVSTVDTVEWRNGPQGLRGDYDDDDDDDDNNNNNNTEYI